jgi:hypothetical protein
MPQSVFIAIGVGQPHADLLEDARRGRVRGPDTRVLRQHHDDRPSRAPLQRLRSQTLAPDMPGRSRNPGSCPSPGAQRTRRSRQPRPRPARRSPTASTCDHRSDRPQPPPIRPRRSLATAGRRPLSGAAEQGDPSTSSTRATLPLTWFNLTIALFAAMPSFNWARLGLICRQPEEGDRAEIEAGTRERRSLASG